MKAERRHELQTNSLALWLRWRLPELWKQHGTKVLIGLIALVALFWFIRWRINAPKKAYAQAQTLLQKAEDSVLNLRFSPRASESKEFIQSVKAGALPATVRSAMDLSDKPYIVALGNAILGDYYWELALHRISPDGTTRPADAEMNDSVLKDAEAAYQKALAAKTDQPDLAARAHIGLGVIYETIAFHDQINKKAGPSSEWVARPDFASAREQFKAVVDDSQAPAVLKAHAEAHLKVLDQLQKPLLVAGIKAPEPPAPAPVSPGATPTTATTTAVPTTSPASPAPALAPAPRPTTVPATTQPVR
jgi:hypothetical protein